MQTQAIILSAPRQLSLGMVELTAPGPQDLVIRVDHSGVSTGTEKLFWTGEMPPFPGMGYPLVPGYEACGEVIEAGADSGYKLGERVFVPGANCFAPGESGPVHGLFGAASNHLVSNAARVTRVDAAMGPEGALLALAATARHAIAAPQATMPELIIGHGVLGRLMARIAIAMGAPAPTVWETNPARATGGAGYQVLDPDADPRRDYRVIMDASGAEGLLDSLIGRIAKGGEVVLAGFYTKPIQFNFVPAFMREARLRIAAEWQADDLTATRDLIDAGKLSLAGLITHHARPDSAGPAYETAFSNPDCLKMIIDWEATA
ncbi:MAG: 3-hydroxyethyl bacteriochlorophyllide a dehydrogenase BchC [Roseibaca calidilacus]|uniref:3-hydroxyethyl bacteriochlorophyllide a dehydrogenase n=1 Tax=Roseibaca calidilacus TaxID=1666912 RepID=A0A0P8A6V7_9RHOB|nr:chlorophyll synthesis pathway protein BchC [Roseibaca calidilacus]KPP89850.1 MAG: 3-hydroxyethyl bacteriochlorophyllide a dehydrogenase BchC [Roseibaca calidilacus]CUX80868.1 3-hydroxyethyl bacteriochlorophyllide a dehydrogenase [Roseibaca calidilacus]